jgi:N-methylhydantoinase B
MEGIYIPMLKLADRGVINETLMAMVRANTRSPVESEGDVYSLAACNDVGCRRLAEMLDEFELHDLGALGDHIIEHSRDAVRAEIAKLPAGRYRNSMTIDGYEHPIELVATTTIEADRIIVDFDGTSPTSRKGINVPLAYTTAYTCFGLSCVISPKIPNNAGSLAPFEVRAPEGSIVNAPKPHAVAIRHVIGQMLPDVVFGCLRQAVPDRVPAEGASALWTLNLRGLLGGGNQAGPGFVISAVTNGGTGARPHKDGLSATAYPSGVRGTPVEIVESTAPLVVWRKELRPDSGGAGRQRGGVGQHIELESACNQPFEVMAAFDRIVHPPRGCRGGKNGARGELALGSGRRLQGKGMQEIPAGDRLVIKTPGGAGLGEPSERARAAVSRDLEDGLISREHAENVYGWAGS